MLILLTSCASSESKKYNDIKGATEKQQQQVSDNYISDVVANKEVQSKNENNNDSTHIDKLQENNFSIHALKLNDSKDRVVEILGLPDSEEEGEMERHYLYYNEGFVISMSPNGTPEKVVTSINITNKDYISDSGVKVGDKLVDALKIYREKYKEYISDYSDIPLIGKFVISDDIVFIIEFDYKQDNEGNKIIKDNEVVKGFTIAYITYIFGI